MSDDITYREIAEEYATRWRLSEARLAIITEALTQLRDRISQADTVGTIHCSDCERIVLTENKLGIGFLASCGRRLMSVSEIGRGGCADRREKLIQIIKDNSSQNMTQEACDRQAERIADALLSRT